MKRDKIRVKPSVISLVLTLISFNKRIKGQKNPYRLNRWLCENKFNVIIILKLMISLTVRSIWRPWFILLPLLLIKPTSRTGLKVLYIVTIKRIFIDSKKSQVSIFFKITRR